MMTILFSIPVHEEPDVVIDQIFNYTTFNPECYIVLHISKNFSFEGTGYDIVSFQNSLKQFDNVLINPERLPTDWADIVHTHISNFKYALSQIEFDYFVFGSSNDLFLKSGLQDIINNHFAGFKMSYLDEGQKWSSYDRAVKDDCLKSICYDFNISINKAIIGQIEGFFVKTDTFKEAVDLIDKHYERKSQLIKYPREEIYFSTVVYYLLKDKECENGLWKDSYVYNAFKYCSYENIMPEHIRFVLKSSNLLAVKRVRRKLNDTIRAYIRDAYGNYYKDEVSMGIMPKRYDKNDLQGYIDIEERNNQSILKNRILKKIKRLYYRIRFCK